jgi:uncharacterized protein YeaO (DUF488 family)
MPPGSVRTRRWNDPQEPGDGTRILITRYRPRGVRKADETWQEWWKDLGPSQALHAAAYGKGQPAIGRDEYLRRYLDEISREPGKLYLQALMNRVAAGESVTLLCSSACVDEARCHRTILRDMLERAGSRGR